MQNTKSPPLLSLFQHKDESIVELLRIHYERQRARLEEEAAGEAGETQLQLQQQVNHITIIPTSDWENSSNGSNGIPPKRTSNSSTRSTTMASSSSLLPLIPTDSPVEGGVGVGNDNTRNTVNSSVNSETKNLNLEKLQRENNAFLNTDNSRSTHHTVRSLFCGSSWEWTEHLVYPALALTMMLVLGHDWAFPDGTDENNNPCATQDGNQIMNIQMCSMMNSLTRAYDQLKFLTPLVLGGFVSSTVGLWRDRRTAYLSLCGAVRNMNVNLGSLLPFPRDCDKQQKVKIIVHARKTMARWSLLGYELSVLKARGEIDNEETAIPHLKELGLLHEGEWEAMVPGDRHTTVWLWLQTKAVQLGNQGMIDQTLHVQTLCTAITLLRDRANDLMSSLNRDQPPPYASIVGLVVNFFLFFTSLRYGMEWSFGFYAIGWQAFLLPAIYIEILVLTVFSLLYGMLFDLCHILYNPFGGRPFDLPHIAVGGGIRKMGRAFASGDYLPPTMDYVAPPTTNKKKDHQSQQQQSHNNNNEEDDESDEGDNFLDELPDHGLFVPEPVDRLQSDRRGSLFRAISRKF